MHRGQHSRPTNHLAKRIAATSTLTLVAGAVAATSAHAATQSQWDCIAQWESGGRWHLSYGDADSTGGLQIQTRTWDGFGGQQYAPQAYEATEAEQIAIAEKILAQQGPGAWTTNYHCGLTRGGYVAPTPRVTKTYTPAPQPSRSVPAPTTRIVYASSKTYIVRPGDCLWTIALDHYGSGDAWTRIYAANRSLIGPNPDLIEVGQTLVLP